VAVGLIILVFIGLGIFDLVVLSANGKWTPTETACPTFPNLTYYEAKQNLFSWHATYQFSPFFNGLIQFECASPNLDIRITVDDQFALRTDRKIVSSVSESTIKDCHGNVLFITRTGDTWEMIINSNRIVVSFELRSPAGDILAYVQGTHFFDDDVIVVGIDGQTVASLHKGWLQIPPVWTFTISQSGHPGSDPRVLSVLAGMRHWIGKNNPDNCNRCFWGIAWSWIGLLVLIFLVGCFIGSIKIRDRMQNSTKFH